MHAPRMQKAHGDGVTIQLAIWEGQGTPVVCIHGLTANCRCWDTIAAALAPRHRVIALDLRGRGLSDKPPTGYAITYHCRDLGAVLDDLALDQAVLMGHSLGAYIALAFAAQHPQRVTRVILVDGGGQLSEDQRAKVFAGIKPSLERLGQVFPSFAAYIRQMQQAPFLQPWSPALETYFRYEIEEVAGGVRSRVQAAHIEEEVQHFQQLDVAALYPQVRCPVLILRATEGMLGADDLLLPVDVVQRLLQALPQARCEDIPGTNHYTIVFAPHAQRDQAILVFLDT